MVSSISPRQSSTIGDIELTETIANMAVLLEQNQQQQQQQLTDGSQSVHSSRKSLTEKTISLSSQVPDEFKADVEDEDILSLDIDPLQGMLPSDDFMYEQASLAIPIPPMPAVSLDVKESGAPDNMVGGRPGHVFRRIWHVSLFISLSTIYYILLLQELNISVRLLQQIVSGVCLGFFVIEAIRMGFGFTCFGMRTYEARQISGNAWGVFSLCIVFLLAPMDLGKYPGALGVPIVWSLAIGDPLLGEARRMGLKFWQVITFGLVGVAAVWISCIFWLGTPWFLIFFMVPITVLSELPRLPFIDDNAMMLLIPLALVLLLRPFL